METLSALLALCARNSLATGEFPPKRPVMRSFDVFFDLRLTKRLIKQWWGWWFETPSRLLWRHCDDRSGWILLPNANALYRSNCQFVNFYMIFARPTVSFVSTTCLEMGFKQVLMAAVVSRDPLTLSYKLWSAATVKIPPCHPWWTLVPCRVWHSESGRIVKLVLSSCVQYDTDAQ